MQTMSHRATVVSCLVVYPLRPLAAGVVVCFFSSLSNESLLHLFPKKKKKEFYGWLYHTLLITKWQMVTSLAKQFENA